MKKKIVLAVIAAALVLAAAIGTTFASFNTSSTPGTTEINLNDMQVALAANIDGNTVVDLITNGLPGQEETVNNFFVSNKGGEHDYDVFTRVVIDKQWENRELDASKIKLFIGENELNAETMAEGKGLAGWMLVEADDEQIILYNTAILTPGASTKEFLTKVAFDSDMNNAYADQEAHITVTVQSVQATAAEKSMPAEWGVYPVFDSEGNLIGVEE